MKPQGLYHVPGSILANDRKLIAGFGIQRHDWQDELSSEELLFAAQVMPYLQRALQLQIKLDSIAAERNTMLALLDRLDIGVISLARPERSCTATPRRMPSFRARMGSS